MVRELKNYTWKEDTTGKTLNVPDGWFNHGIDTTRYYILFRNIAKKNCPSKKIKRNT